MKIIKKTTDKGTKLALFSLIFLILLPFTFTKKEETLSPLLLKSLYDLAHAQNSELFYTSVQNAKREILYANAKSTDKYRLSALLGHVEKCGFGSNDATAENIKSDLSEMFDSCRIFCPEEFYAKTDTVYENRLALSESEFAESRNFSESFKSRCKESPAGRNVHSFLPNDKDTSSSFLYETSEKSENENLFFALCFEGCTKKRAVSPDGTLWFYGDNYLCGEDPEGRPLYVLSKSGKRDLAELFDKKAVFSRTPVLCETVSSSDDFELFHVFHPSSPENYISLWLSKGGFAAADLENYRPPRDR